VGKHTPLPKVAAILELLTPLAVKLGEVSQANPIPLEDVYSKYSGMRRARYARAHANLRERDYVITKRDAQVKMFVKMEAYKLNPSKPFPDCRAIQHRSYEYTLMLASKIKAAEHKMFSQRDIEGFGEGRIFAKNLNQVAKAACLKEHYDGIPDNVLCLDASRFDAHCNVHMLEHVEHRTWNAAVADKELRRLLHMQLDNRATATFKTEEVKYRVKGGRMSGDANTSGGNCIIMATMLAAFGRFIKRKFRFCCDGDDSVFFHDGEAIPDDMIHEFFKQFGFVMSVDARPKSFEEIEFCQSNPVLVDGVWTMIRNPLKVLSKMGLTHKKDDSATYVKRLLTTATCENFLAQGVPILQSYTRNIILRTESLLSLRQRRRSKYLNISEVGWRLGQELSKVVDLGDRAISQSTRESFARAFGVSVEEQKRAEEYLVSWEWDVKMSAGGSVADSWYLEGPYPEWTL